MKNAPTTNSSESAPDKRDYTPGILPKRCDTVRAAALAAMLEGEHLTGLDSVFKHSTTRLSAVICDALEKKYGWPINHSEVLIGTSDGRITPVTTYWLSQETIAQAFEGEARTWIMKVKVARAEQRKQVGKCKAEAAKRNAIRAQLRKHDPRQGDLWGGL
jgi:hypothetical protein